MQPLSVALPMEFLPYRYCSRPDQQHTSQCTEKPKTPETVKKETKATTKNTQSKAVKTGDNTNITLYTSLLIISVIVVAGTIVLRKKKS